MEKLEVVKKFSIKIMLSRKYSCPVIRYIDLGSGIPISKIPQDQIKEIYIDIQQNVRMD